MNCGPERWLLPARIVTADALAYEAQIDALVFRAYGLSETNMLYVLDQFPTVGSREREMIQNNFRSLARGHFALLDFGWWPNCVEAGIFVHGFGSSRL